MSVPSAQRPTDVADWDQLSCDWSVVSRRRIRYGHAQALSPEGLTPSPRSAWDRRGSPWRRRDRGCGAWCGCRRCPGDWASGGRPCGGPPAEDRGPRGQAAARAGAAGRPAAHSSTGLTQDRRFGGSRSLNAITESFFATLECCPCGARLPPSRRRSPRPHRTQADVAGRLRCAAVRLVGYAVRVTAGTAGRGGQPYFTAWMTGVRNGR